MDLFSHQYLSDRSKVTLTNLYMNWTNLYMNCTPMSAHINNYTGNKLIMIIINQMRIRHMYDFSSCPAQIAIAVLDKSSCQLYEMVS